MGYKVLYRKYRPDSFDNVVGQDYTISMLKNAIDTGKNAHAYIFTGPRGTGKTSSAKIFAKALNCENPVGGNPCNECSSCLSFSTNPDVIEIDAASNNGVDEIRELINNVKLVPSASKYKVYIIDEVHMLSTSAFNALLLTLEEPPSHVVFVLATTDIQDVPITILSRCQRFDFKPINRESIVSRLKYVCSEESIKITDDAISEIALISAGGMRDALGMLDQLSNDDQEITLEMVSSYFGSVSVKKINELLTSIEENNSTNLVKLIGEIRDSGTNYAVFVEKLILELRKSAISLKSGKCLHNFTFETIYNMIFDLNECLCNININVNPYVLIEIVLLKYVSSGNILGNDFVSNSKDSFNFNAIGGSGNSEVLSESKIPAKIEDLSKSSGANNADNSALIHNTTLNIDVNIRINNCFVEASKEYKSKLSKSWVDFMNFLMSKDRNLVSLLADTSILAASPKYVLIQSKIDTTNDLLNSSILNIEKHYKEFSGICYKFAAINDDLWLKEVEKYRNNLKNKIKYSYVQEEEDVTHETSVTESTESDIEKIAGDIFGTFEVE